MTFSGSSKGDAQASTFHREPLLREGLSLVAGEIISIVADDGRRGRFDVSPYLIYEALEDLRKPGEFLKVLI